MTTQTLTLTDFLLARIAEDEAVARAVVELDYSEGYWAWRSHNPPPYRSALTNERGSVVLPSKNDDVYPSAAVAEHIVRWDPARVLAECESKRLLIKRVGNPAWAGFKIMAQPYAEHRDFREEWRP